MLFSPFEQFQIQNYNLLNFTYGFTDTILISLNLVFFLQLIYLTLNFKVSYTYFGTFFYSIFQGIYNFIYSTIDSYSGDKKKMEKTFLFYPLNMNLLCYK